MPTRVLVVDDDEDLRDLYRVTLNLAGFETSTAANAIDALRRIDRDPPDAIVLDIGLPLISGIAVREDLAAQAHTRHIPILVVTGSPENFDYLNVNCVLRKPVSSEQLVDALRKCLRSAE